MSRVISRGATTSVQGRAQGPLRGVCEVLAHGRIGAYHSITFVAPDMAERSQPGQFVSVAVENEARILRRPFSIYAVSQHGPWAGTIEIVYDIIGPGTAWLASLRKHDVVDLVGPLGRGFPLPQLEVSCLLVGGGYGSAPLHYLAHTLQRSGFRVDMVIGASTQGRIFNAIETKRLSTSAIFTTEDGSFGVRGRVTDVLEQALHQSGAGVIYACGPMPMLAAVALKARERRVPCQVAVEEAMACGTGVCMTCVLPFRRRDGLAYLRSCIDGPVFDGKRVEWSKIGPQDALVHPPDEELRT